MTPSTFLSDLWAVFLKYGGGDPTKGAALAIMLASLLWSFIAASTIHYIDKVKDNA